MKHLTISDLRALQYHQELGDIMDDDYYSEVVLHLDNCKICKDRFIIENNKIVDKKDIIEEKLMQMMSEIIQGSVTSKRLDNLSDFTDFCASHKDYKIMNDLLSKYHDFGGSMLGLANKLRSKMELSDEYYS